MYALRAACLGAIIYPLLMWSFTTVFTWVFIAVRFPEFASKIFPGMFYVLPSLVSVWFKSLAMMAAQGFIAYGIVGILISATRNETKVGIVGYALLGTLAAFVTSYLPAVLSGWAMTAISISIANYKWLALNIPLYVAIGAIVGWRMTKYVQRRASDMQTASG